MIQMDYSIDFQIYQGVKIVLMEHIIITAEKYY